MLNGPPGIGKSTLARRYVDERPMTLCLEQDVVRHLLGGWESSQPESGRLTRQLCLAMARAHLMGGHDVVVPQFVALPAYLDQLEQVAAEAGAGYLEVLLIDDRDAAERRFHARVDDPARRDHQLLAARYIAEAGGFRAEYERMLKGVAGRKLVRIQSVEGDVDATYAAVVRASMSHGTSTV